MAHSDESDAPLFKLLGLVLVVAIVWAGLIFGAAELWPSHRLAAALIGALCGFFWGAVATVWGVNRWMG